jgi:hypothetical protein
MTTPRDQMDPDAPPSVEELRAAAELRDALADPARPNDDAAFARALALAHAPRELSPEDHRAILARALKARGNVTRALKARGNVTRALKARGNVTGALDARALAPSAGGDGRRGRVIRVAFGASVSALAVAIAAAFVLWIRADEATPQALVTSPPLAEARSTQPLFRDPFPARGGESARIDRIAMARASDFRDNEYSRWGVR